LIGALGRLHGWVYVQIMAATLSWTKDTLATATAGTTGVGMSFMICAAMSLQTTVVPRIAYSG
jgi:cysteine synthase